MWSRSDADGLASRRRDIVAAGTLTSAATCVSSSSWLRANNHPDPADGRRRLANHRHQVWACDFLQIHDLWFRPRFAFFIIEQGSRKVVHVGVTRPNRFVGELRTSRHASAASLESFASSRVDPVSVHLGSVRKWASRSKQGRQAAIHREKAEGARWTERERPVKVTLTTLSHRSRKRTNHVGPLDLHRLRRRTSRDEDG
jgi:hypothetical protein